MRVQTVRRNILMPKIIFDQIMNIYLPTGYKSPNEFIIDSLRQRIVSLVDSNFVPPTVLQSPVFPPNEQKSEEIDNFPSNSTSSTLIAPLTPLSEEEILAEEDSSWKKALIGCEAPGLTKCLHPVLGKFGVTIQDPIEGEIRKELYLCALHKSKAIKEAFDVRDLE